MDVTKTHTAHDLAHDSPLISCRYDPSGQYVFAGSQDYNVWRFEVTTGAKTAYAADAWVRGMAFDRSRQQMITGGYDGRLIWWPVTGDDPQPQRTLEAHDGWIRAVSVSPDDQLLASAGNDQVVRLWDLNDGSLVHELTGHESHIYNVAFHPDGKRLATGDLMANVCDWDLPSAERQRSWQAESLQKYDKTFVATIGGFRGMTFSPDGRFLACGGITNVTNAFAGVGNPSVVVFDWESGGQQIEHLSKAKLRGVAWGVVMHPDNIRIAASGGSGGYLLFWKPDQVEEFHQLKLKDTARDLDLSPDGLHLATAHHNGHITISRMAAPES